jgi:hypothetical protein
MRDGGVGGSFHIEDFVLLPMVCNGYGRRGGAARAGCVHHVIFPAITVQFGNIFVRGVRAKRAACASDRATLMC